MPDTHALVAVPGGRRPPDVPVALLRWPEQDDERRRLAERGEPRILVTAAGTSPPSLLDPLEAWIVDDAGAGAVVDAVAGLRHTVRSQGRPRLDDDGLLWFHDRWVAVSEAQLQVVGLLVRNFGRVVRYEALHEAYSQVGPRGDDPGVAVGRPPPRPAPVGRRPAAPQRQAPGRPARPGVNPGAAGHRHAPLHQHLGHRREVALGVLRDAVDHELDGRRAGIDATVWISRAVARTWVGAVPSREAPGDLGRAAVLGRSGRRRRTGRPCRSRAQAHPRTRCCSPRSIVSTGRCRRRRPARPSRAGRRLGWRRRSRGRVAGVDAVGRGGGGGRRPPPGPRGRGAWSPWSSAARRGGRLGAVVGAAVAAARRAGVAGCRRRVRASRRVVAAGLGGEGGRRRRPAGRPRWRR